MPSPHIERIDATMNSIEKRERQGLKNAQAIFASEFQSLLQGKDLSRFSNPRRTMSYPTFRGLTEKIKNKGTLPLFVPYALKDFAKNRLACHWDKEQQLWVTRDATALLFFPLWDDGWDMLNDYSTEFEDRQFGNGLYVDLIPKANWGDSLAKTLHPEIWEYLSRGIKKRAHYTCELCGRQNDDNGNRLLLNAHERFRYDDSLSTQEIMPFDEEGYPVYYSQAALARLICICEDCHNATHLSHAQIVGKDHQALIHLKRINRWNDEELQKHVRLANKTWLMRNDIANKILSAYRVHPLEINGDDCVCVSHSLVEFPTFTRYYLSNIEAIFSRQPKDLIERIQPS